MSVSFQGPCIGNQQSLAHSRLWDAVVGFLHVFANMQMKLSQVNPTRTLCVKQSTTFTGCSLNTWLNLNLSMLPTNSHFGFVQDSSQIELLKELMDLQKDMVVMMLSLLEGRHFFFLMKHVTKKV